MHLYRGFTQLYYHSQHTKKSIWCNLSLTHTEAQNHAAFRCFVTKVLQYKPSKITKPVVEIPLDYLKLMEKKIKCDLLRKSKSVIYGLFKIIE